MSGFISPVEVDYSVTAKINAIATCQMNHILACVILLANDQVEKGTKMTWCLKNKLQIYVSLL